MKTWSVGWKRLKNKPFIQEQKQEVQAGNDKNLDGKIISISSNLNYQSFVIKYFWWKVQTSKLSKLEEKFGSQ